MKEPTDSWNIMNGVNIVWDQALSFGLAIVNIHVVIFCVEVFARPWCVAVSERGAVRAVGADTGAHLVNVMNLAQ